MSAEKEIVNFWYVQQGYSILNVLKHRNRDVGILAVKLAGGQVADALYADVSCSISGSMMDAADEGASVESLIDERFDNQATKAVKELYSPSQLGSSRLRNVLIISPLPKTRKNEIVERCAKAGVEVIEFEHVLGAVMEKLDTQYYKNEVIRTMQLVKYMLLSNPKMVAHMMGGKMLTSSLKEELVSLMASQDGFVRGFRNMDGEKMGAIIRNSPLKNPQRLAEVMQSSVLTSKTRKPFVDSLMKQKGMPRMKKKKEVSLSKYF